MEVTAVEYSESDHIYRWDHVDGAQGFVRRTIQPVAQLGAAGRLRAFRMMFRELDGSGADVVAVPGWSMPDALSALLWSCRRRRGAVIMSESTRWDSPRSRVGEAVKRRIIGLAGAGLAGGTPHAGYLAELGMKRERIHLGYNAVDNDHFACGAVPHRNGTCAPDCRGRLPRPYFLTSARFVPQKNLDMLVRSYHRYLSRFPGEAAGAWDLVMVGDGPEKAEIAALAGRLGLGGRVHLPGFLQYDQLSEYYGHASAFVLASSSEPWGLVVNEAMASGLPVLVSSRCGCAADLVSEGENGYLIDPESEEQLSLLMGRLSTAGFPLSDHGKASERIIAAWSPERFAGGLEAAGRDALQLAGRRRPLSGQLAALLMIFRTNSV
jgi:glycosyltransferase involved in cell wall biosynthesis